jgi:hypothetical protein
MLKEGRILSFFELTEYPWDKVCDRGTVEEFDSSEWAFSQDEDKRRDFVQLLNLSLKEKVKADLNYNKFEDYYYFKPTPNLSEQRITYQISGRRRARSVFKGFESHRDPTKVAYYRHSAFESRLHLHDNVWYLEITPTYHFTRDGYRPYRYSEDRLSGIKKLERNLNVLGQLLMWAWYLTKPQDMFSANYPFLQFGDLLEFEIHIGIDDNTWLGHEEEKEAEPIRSSWRELPLFIQ